MPLKLWIRCPYGCYFEVDAPVWTGLTRGDKTKFECKTCHRSEPIVTYQREDRSAAVAASSSTLLPNKPWQLALDESILKRIGKLYGNIRWFGFNQQQELKQLYRMVVQMLMNSELTSNFPTPRIWGLLDSGGALKNIWAQGNNTNKTYAKERDEGERKLFGKLDNVSVAPTGDQRPYYMALSPGNLQQGAAPYYGRSYVVYKTAVRTRCTFTATDSLQMLKTAESVSLWEICNFATIGNILMRVSDRQLLYLCELARGGKVESPNEFIEAQGWGAFNLQRDVAIIVISEEDLKRMETDRSVVADLLPPHLLELNAEQRRANIGEMRRRLRDFCNMHGIELKFLALGPETMNSRETRPA